MYVGGLLFYSVGMTLMALTRARMSVIIFSWSAGVMYSTLFTMPYLLVAHYHANATVTEKLIYFLLEVAITDLFAYVSLYISYSLKLMRPVMGSSERRCVAWAPTLPL